APLARLPSRHGRHPGRRRSLPRRVGGRAVVTRSAEQRRETSETSIAISLAVDGSGSTEVATGIPFYDHMLGQLGRHGGFDLVVEARGDLAVDTHHTVEDVGILLGAVLKEALGDK